MARARKPSDADLPPERRASALLRGLKRKDVSRLVGFKDRGQLDPAALGVAKEQQAIVRFLRTAPFAGIPGVIGAGLGLREVKGEETGEIAAVVLVRRKLPRSKLAARHLLPDYVTHDNQRIRIDVQTGFDPMPRPAAMGGGGSFVRASGSISGSALSPAALRDPCSGGTLTGRFDNRALTCAHVAFGFGFEAFLANLPVSLLWLFESPRGSRLIASSGQQVGQGLFQLFRVDTDWPILVPWLNPLSFAGGLGFLYVDGAAGDVAPQVIQPFFPGTTPFSFPGVAPQADPPRSSRFGGRISPARPAIPGERCHKDGQTSGMTYGRVWLPFFMFYLPVPLGLVTTFVLFDLVLCRLVIGPGDSGSAGLAHDQSYLFQVSLGIPLPAGTTGGGSPPGVICPVSSTDLLALTIGTPYYLHELFPNVNLS